MANTGRILAVLSSSALIALFALTTTARAAPEPAAADSGAHYPVVLNEMSIATGWQTVPAGPIVLDISNAGKVTHELVVLRTNLPHGQIPPRPTDPSKASEDTSIGEVENIAPGATASLKLNLAPGRYVLICNEPGHYTAGMHVGFMAVTFVGVTLTETSITLDQTTVPAGPVVDGVQNTGSVVHELVVLKTNLAPDNIPQRANDPSRVSEDGSVAEVEDVSVSRYSGLLLDLEAGKYVLICNKPGHYAVGMRVALTVVPIVNVTLKEMSIQVDPSTVSPGPVTFAIKNSGSVTHELAVLRTDLAEDKIPARPNDPSKVQEDGIVGEAEDIEEGTLSRLSLVLSAGHYVLICNEPGHYAAGMHATFTVK